MPPTILNIWSFGSQLVALFGRFEGCGLGGSVSLGVGCESLGTHTTPSSLCFMLAVENVNSQHPVPAVMSADSPAPWPSIPLDL